MIDKTFLLDSVRQLRYGMKVYVFKEKQVKAIIERCKEKYNLSVHYKKVENYYILIPAEKQCKGNHY